MPTYQYACTACDERLEVIQKFTDDPLTVCEACGGKLRKLFSAVGIVFKGSGFYRTDSRNGSSGSNGASKKDSPAASNGSEATSGSGASAGDGKPAKKAEGAGASAPAAGAKVA